MAKIAIYTQTYNAQSFIDETVKSVLNQTFTDFEYFIGDDCSADNTRKHINKLAKRDPRIKPIFYQEDDPCIVSGQRSGSHVAAGYRHMLKESDAEWICLLDHDDLYEKDFLQEMLDFVNGHSLDAGCCGTRFFMGKFANTAGFRSVPDDLVIHGQGWSDYFPYYHQFMRTNWAKLFSREVFEQADFSIYYDAKMSTGKDTCFTFSALKGCERIGVSHKILHNYRMSTTGSSYILRDSRVTTDARMYHYTLNFLIQKSGRVTNRNFEFLQTVHANNLRDCINVILRAPQNADRLDEEKRIRYLNGLFSINTNADLFRCRVIPAELMDKLLEPVSRYLDAGADDAADVLKLKEIISGLRESGKASADTTKAFARSVLNLIGDMPQGRMSDQEWCNLFRCIFTDGAFADALRIRHVREDFYGSVLQKSGEMDGLLKKNRYENFALMILYGARTHNIWLFLAGFFDGENRFGWGVSTLAGWQKERDSWFDKIFTDVDWESVSAKCPDFIIKLLEGRYASVMHEIPGINSVQYSQFMQKEWIVREKRLAGIKNAMREALEQGESIDTLIAQALSVRLLDRDVVQYILFSDINAGNRNRITDMAYMIRSVYGRDAQMLYMAYLAFDFLGREEKALECIGQAVDCADDANRRQEYMQELEQLRSRIL
ncbi:MAG: glycosyltransferase family 2 protein [Lachnospiraceae bacterium]|nr:glycosyltransferase family 2 protein [Lachnospiraceae bacterium]